MMHTKHCIKIDAGSVPRSPPSTNPPNSKHIPDIFSRVSPPLILFYCYIWQNIASKLTSYPDTYIHGYGRGELYVTQPSVIPINNPLYSFQVVYILPRDDLKIFSVMRITQNIFQPTRVVQKFNYN